MITIVMPYFNRKPQLLKTLRTIELTKCDDFEVTIIDDASRHEERIEDLINDFNFKIKLVRVEPEEKKWISEPLAIINGIIRECRNEIIIYQGAECLHIGDIISMAAESTIKGAALSFACMNPTPPGSIFLRDYPAGDLDSFESLKREVQRWIDDGDWSELQEKASELNANLWWYNHGKFTPRGDPFCIAMAKEFYLRIGGFDEAFSYGCACVDSDFTQKIRKYGGIIFVNNPFVIHQNHPTVWDKLPNKDELVARNKHLFEENCRKRLGESA